jgi:hypothetical protein
VAAIRLAVALTDLARKEGVNCVFETTCGAWITLDSSSSNLGPTVDGLGFAPCLGYQKIDDEEDAKSNVWYLMCRNVSGYRFPYSAPIG